MNADGDAVTVEQPSAEAKLPEKTPPSQRHIAWEDGDADLHVPESMQNFVYKKLSKMIADSVEFVDVDVKPSKKRKTRGGVPTVKLLKDTAPIDLDAKIIELDVINQVKPVIKRRLIESDQLVEEDMIKAAVIDADSITKSTECWEEKSGKDRKLFRYREKNGVFYQIEPDNEFTKMRKKNNWIESKIAKFGAAKNVGCK